MRLFVAVDVSDATRDALRDIRRQLEPLLQQARRPPRLTWVDPAIAHVTLRFIGEVPDEHTPRIVEALSPPLAEPAFDVRWAGIGTFPGGRSPRVVWVGAAGGLEPLARLAGEVHARLTLHLGPGESRPFKAHLTVARVKEPGTGVDWPRALAAVACTASVSHVDRVTLYRSRTSPRGPTYDPVGVWTLSPP